MILNFLVPMLLKKNVKILFYKYIQNTIPSTHGSSHIGSTQEEHTVMVATIQDSSTSPTLYQLHLPRYKQTTASAEDTEINLIGVLKTQI